MAKSYSTITENVTAVQFTFDTAKEVYLFLGYADIVYQVKDRVLSGTITGKDGMKIPVHKNDFVVKDSKGNVTVWNPDDFKKHFVEAKASAEK